MANRQRGEVVIKLSGKDYTLRPTFEALCELEDVANDTVIRMLAEMEGGRVRLKPLSLIIWAGMLGFNRETAPSPEEVGEMVVATGILGLLEQTDSDGKNPISEFLIGGVLGGDEPSKETKEGGTESDPKPTAEENMKKKVPKEPSPPT